MKTIINSILKFVKNLFMKNSGDCDSCFDRTVCQTLDRNKKYAVILGLEKSKWGSCPGSTKDSNTMFSLVSQYMDNDHIIRLNDSQATVKNVVDALNKQISKVPEDGLFTLVYSGHGGQMKKGGSYKDETDGMDEFLCLYDGYLLDNDLWTIFNQCKGRVLFIVDACHSSTMYRLPSEDVDEELSDAENRLPIDGPFMGKFENVRAAIRLLCISGCGEETVSWGDAVNGGVLTSSMKRAFNKCLTYREWWNKFRTDSAFRKVKQVPYCTKVGDFDLNAKVFN